MCREIVKGTVSGMYVCRCAPRMASVVQNTGYGVSGTTETVEQTGVMFVESHL